MGFAIFSFLALSLLGTLAYAATYRYGGRLGWGARLALWLASGACAALWLLFGLYYWHFYDDWVWLFRLRAAWGIELTAAFVGVFCALMQTRVLARRQARDLFSRHNGLLLLFILLAPPYVKPVLRPVSPVWDDKWNEGVCLQSTGYTCGPAAAATLLRLYGVETSEEQVAGQVYLNSHGSEAWHLARCLRRAGLKVRFVSTPPNPAQVPVPSIAGVRLGGKDGPGHFITVLDQTSSTLTIGDPLSGRFVWARDKCRENYHFAGFFMHVLPGGRAQRR